MKRKKRKKKKVTYPAALTPPIFPIKNFPKTIGEFGILGHKHLAWLCNKTFSLPKKKKKKRERISKEKLRVKLGRLVLLLYLYRITYSHRIGHVVRAKMLSSAYDRSFTSLQRIGMPVGTE